MEEKMQKITIIAEAGVNHNGDIERAKDMVRAAKDSGADYVKFQTYTVDGIASRLAGMAEYQKKNIGEDMPQTEMLRSLELPYEAFSEIRACCDETGIRFLSTPFEIEAVRYLDRLQDLWKVPSGEITNYPYLLEIAHTGKPVILSTGMSTMDEIRACVDLLRREGSGEITLLHCTTDYPTRDEDVNLLAMRQLADEFACPVGYSDHTTGIAVDLAAAALGACVIEKHFTLDRSLPGPDHKASLEPDELKEMVEGIRRIEKALGDGIKRPIDAELKNIAVARKSIVAKIAIAEGEIFSVENLTTKRPGNGVSAMLWPEVLGRRAKRAFEADELIEL